MSVVDLTSRGRSRSRGSMSSRSRRRPRASSSISSSMSSSSRVPRYLPLKGIHKFERTIPINYAFNPSKGFIEASGGATVGYSIALTYTLNACIVKGAGVYNQPFALPQVGEFTALFDSWRIDSVDIKMVSGLTTGTPQGTTGHTMPPLYIVNDHDDGLPLGTANEIFQRENVKVISFSDTNIKNHRVYPRLATQHYNGVALSGYGQGSRYAFVDSAYGNVELYGTKIIYPSPGSSVDVLLGTITFLVKYNMTFKGVI